VIVENGFQTGLGFITLKQPPLRAFSNPAGQAQLPSGWHSRPSGQPQKEHLSTRLACSSQSWKLGEQEPIGVPSTQSNGFSLALAVTVGVVTSGTVSEAEERAFQILAKQKIKKTNKTTISSLSTWSIRCCRFLRRIQLYWSEHF
jgi:hypothetical protein